MKLFAAVLAVGLLVLVGWFMFQIEKPGPNVGELDGLAILRVMNGEISPPDYCARRGAEVERSRYAKLAKKYETTMAPAGRDIINRTFFAVDPSRQKEFDQAKGFIEQLQKNRGLVLDPGFRPQLVIITEFLTRQCLLLAPQLP